ncbi:MAG: energy transducer TonB [Bacteroidales bacterium]|nr:energy transducer TonB [Bacteroidales bacterium]
MSKLTITSTTKTLLLFVFFVVISFSIRSQTVFPPECAGGNRLTREFIDEEMIYPDKAMQAGIEGTVDLSFIVHEDGSVSNIDVIQKVSPEVDAEAIRLFKHICWNPATELGRPITVKHSYKIKFNIRRYTKITKSRGVNYFERPHEKIDTSFKVYRREETDHWPRPIFTSIDRNLPTFIVNNLEYPDAAKKQNISGVVKLQFVVETSGRVSNIVVLNAVGGGCTEEAIRVLRLIKWYPGLKNDIAVRTIMEFDLRFDLANNSVGGTIPNPGQIY